MGTWDLSFEDRGYPPLRDGESSRDPTELVRQYRIRADGTFTFKIGPRGLKGRQLPMLFGEDPIPPGVVAYEGVWAHSSDPAVFLIVTPLMPDGSWSEDAGYFKLEGRDTMGHSSGRHDKRRNRLSKYLGIFTRSGP